MTPKGKAKLEGHEGNVLHGYTDSEGFLTIGIGHLIDPRKGGSISPEICRLLFDDDIAQKTKECQRAFPWFDGLDPVRHDVIVNLVFNMGVGGLKGFKKMLAAIENQNWTEAAKQLKNSKWATQVGPTRRDDLAFALETGTWS